MIETIGFPVTANQSSAGNYLPIDSDTLAGCTVTNSSAYAVEYSTGGAWKTIAAGGSATINTGAIATTSLRFRKKAGDSIPVVLSVAVTHPGVTQAQLATDVAGNTLGVVDASGSSLINLADGNVSNGSLLCDWVSNGTLTLQSANGGGEAVSVDSSVLCNGLPSLKCTLSSGTFTARFALSVPVSMIKMRTLQIPIRFDTNVDFVDGSNPIQVWLYDSTFAKTWRAQCQISTLKSGEWNVISLRAGAATEGWALGGGTTNTSELDAETIARIHVVIAVPATAAGKNIWLGPVRWNQRRKGMVSIVMDGEYDSQGKYILPILNGYGLRSSLALVHQNVGLAGFLTYSQLDDAYNNYGHEIIHHTYSNVKTNGYANATDWPTQSDIQSDIQAGQDNLRNRGYTRGLGYAVHGYGYPFDRTVSQARQDVVSAAYAAAGINGIRKSVPVYNRLQNTAVSSMIPRQLIQGAAQITNTTTATDITELIDRAEANGEWAIITVHKAVLDGATPASLEMKIGDFEAWIAYLAAKVRAGGVIAPTFGEGCRKAGIS